MDSSDDSDDDEEKSDLDSLISETDSIYELARELEVKERERRGEDVEIEGFQPAEMVWIVDAFFSKRYSRRTGFRIGRYYQRSVMIAFIGIWLPFSYFLSFSTGSGLSGETWALFSVTIGTFVLISGSSLVDRFGEKDLNFKAYIHNSITFIVSGVLLAVGYIIQSAFEPSLNLTLNLPITVLLMINNLVAALLFTLSIWVLLKILWRLNQLIIWKAEYTDKSPYSDFLGYIVGFYYGVTFGGEISLTRVIILWAITISSFVIPYWWTSSIIWGIVGFVSVSIIRTIIAVVSFHYSEEESKTT